MKVFISWSGTKSHKVAMLFREWLPSVIQSLEPYVSSEDIDKGARWSTDIATELEDSSFGIICVTKDNINAPWISFEAGALSKSMDKSFVTPFLFDIKRSEVDGPILQFQSTIFEREDIKKLVCTLNKACDKTGIPESRLDNAFDVWYPSLEEKLNQISKTKEETEGVKQKNTEAHNSAIMEELLMLSRDNTKLLRNSDNKMNNSIEKIYNKLDEIRSSATKISGADAKNVAKDRMFYPVVDEYLLSNPVIKQMPQYGFMIMLNSIKDEYPWLYFAGEALLEWMNSKMAKTKKKDAINAYQELVLMSARRCADSYSDKALRYIYRYTEDLLEDLST